MKAFLFLLVSSCSLAFRYACAMEAEEIDIDMDAKVSLLVLGNGRNDLPVEVHLQKVIIDSIPILKVYSDSYERGLKRILQIKQKSFEIFLEELAQFQTNPDQMNNERLLKVLRVAAALDVELPIAAESMLNKADLKYILCDTGWCRTLFKEKYKEALEKYFTKPNQRRLGSLFSKSFDLKACNAHESVTKSELPVELKNYPDLRQSPFRKNIFFSPDERLIAFIVKKKNDVETIHVENKDNLRDRYPLYRLPVEEGSIEDVSLDPTNRYMTVIYSEDVSSSKLMIWDLQLGKRLFSPIAVNALTKFIWNAEGTYGGFISEGHFEKGAPISDTISIVDLTGDEYCFSSGGQLYYGGARDLVRLNNGLALEYSTEESQKFSMSIDFDQYKKMISLLEDDPGKLLVAVGMLESAARCNGANSKGCVSGFAQEAKNVYDSFDDELKNLLEQLLKKISMPPLIDHMED